MIITIDGASKIGKTRTAKALAFELNLPFLSTGGIIRQFVNMTRMYPQDSLHLQCNSSNEYLLKRSSIPAQSTILHGIEAAKLGARDSFKVWLKDFFDKWIIKSRGLVAEGRDAGSLLFPEANYKFFLKVFKEDLKSRLTNKQYKEARARDKLKQATQTKDMVEINAAENTNIIVSRIIRAINSAGR